MNTLIKVIAFLAFATVCLAEELVDCDSKYTKVTDDKDHAAIFEECAKELKLPKLKESEAPKPLTDVEYKGTNYDDKCVAKCFMGKMGLLGEGKAKFNREKVIANGEKRVKEGEEDFKKTITEFTTKCLDEAEKFNKETDTECTAPAYFAYCIDMAQSKICKPVNPPTA